MEKVHAIRSATKLIQIRRDIEHSPQGYLSNTLGGVQVWGTEFINEEDEVFTCDLQV
jgi:hypothetical protein